MVDAGKVLLAGAGGRLGGQLLKELAARGYGVRALTRDPCTMAGEDLDVFGVAVGTVDVVAPAYGTHTLAEHFRSLAAAAR